MPSVNRPLSPHLQIYRPQLTSVLSILHRATGVFLSLGAVALVYWLVAASQGADAFAAAQGVLGSFVGRLLLLGSTFALFYHLGNGIRHLVWDAGFGFDLRSVTVSGWIVVGAAAALTLLSWALAYALR